jgi:hypothetical protein
MIVIFSTRDSVWSSFIACLPNNLNKESFISAAGAEGGLALQLVERIYDVLTVNTSDLSYEYKIYYAPEYDSFEAFLYWKYDVDSELLDQIGDCPLEHSHLVLGRVYAGGDNVGWLIEGDNPPVAVDAITSILATLQAEACNED